MALVQIVSYMHPGSEVSRGNSSYAGVRYSIEVSLAMNALSVLPCLRTELTLSMVYIPQFCNHVRLRACVRGAAACLWAFTRSVRHSCG